MLSNYVVNLLIFLILVLLISHLSKISLYKMINYKKRIKEGMDECNQNEKDELYKQKLKINEIKTNNTKLKKNISDLEIKLESNKEKIKKNSEKVKSMVEKSKKDGDEANKVSESIKM